MLIYLTDTPRIPDTPWGTLLLFGAQKFVMGYKIYRRSTFSKLLPRIVSINTIKPNKGHSE